MKILILTQRWYPDTFGGSEHVAAEQAKRLAQRGHQVSVLTEYTQGHLAPQERERYPTGGELFLARYGQPEQFQKWGSSLIDLLVLPKLIKKLHQEKNFEVAILHHPYPAYAFFLTKLKIPSLYLFHASTAREAEIEGLRRRFTGLWQLGRPFLVNGFIIITRLIEKRVLKQAKRIAVFSDYSFNLLQEIYPQPKEKILKLPVGIETEQFTLPLNKEEAKQRLGFNPHRLIILTVRRLTARMGLTELLYASLQLREVFPEAQVLIIGEGPLREALSNEIDQLNLRNFVSLVGKVPLKDLPLYYQAADVFVLPTTAFEGLGMATLEALASGLPVVGTPVGATPEILNKISPRLLTKGEKAEDIAQGLIGFLSLPQEERELLGKKCRRLAETDYNWDKAIDNLELVLKQLLAS
jgi:glycosyltransferase involved in cell wall biosynthesis